MKKVSTLLACLIILVIQNCATPAMKAASKFYAAPVKNDQDSIFIYANIAEKFQYQSIPIEIVVENKSSGKIILTYDNIFLIINDQQEMPLSERDAVDYINSKTKGSILIGTTDPTVLAMLENEIRESIFPSGTILPNTKKKGVLYFKTIKYEIHAMKLLILEITKGDKKIKNTEVQFNSNPGTKANQY